MRVSVVICAYTMERWDALNRAVSSCLEQSRAPDEIVLVIDHNDLMLRRASTELKGVVVAPNHATKGLSGARNTGVSLTTGDVVVFLDDDAYADPTWLEHLLSPLDDPSVAGVGGWILPEWDGPEASWFPETYYWIIGCSYEGLPQTGATLRNPIGASMAIRREVFTAVGGFAPGIGRIGKVPLGCEETELCIRYTAAHPDQRFVLTRKAIVHHLVPPSRRSWHYFRTRCWAEGLSKAAVSSLVGAKSGLASARQHVMRSLPRELAASVLALPRDPRNSATKILLIFLGAIIAAAGLARGRLALRRSPLSPDVGVLDPRLSRADGTTGPRSSASRSAG